MTKELETLKRIKQFNFGHIMDVDLKDFDLIETALKRLEAIDNASPSEALECLENFIDECQTEMYNYAELQNGYQYEKYQYRKEQLETIKQALITKSKKELAFDVIKEKIKYKGLDEYMKEQIVILGKDGEVVLFTPEDKEFYLLKEVV